MLSRWRLLSRPESASLRTRARRRSSGSGPKKAKQVEPYNPGKLERALLWYKEVDPVEKLAPYNGFYVQLGFQFKPVGSGLGLGGGYRHDLFHRNARIDLGAGITLRNYQMLLADSRCPDIADNRFELGVHALYRHNPQEDFGGIGPDSLNDNRVSYRVNFTNYEVRVIARPLKVGSRPAPTLGWLSGLIGPGQRHAVSDDRGRFAEAERRVCGAAGLPARRGCSAWSTPRSGECARRRLLQVTWRRYSDLDFDLHNFRDSTSISSSSSHLRQEAGVRGARPAAWRRPRTSAAGAVLLPADGRRQHESAKLRGLPFPRRQRVALNAEYRWEAFSGLDMALFSDWGPVAPRWATSLRHLKHAYGIGFRFNTYKTVFYRIDIGSAGAEASATFSSSARPFDRHNTSSLDRCHRV